MWTSALRGLRRVAVAGVQRRALATAACSAEEGVAKAASVWRRQGDDREHFATNGSLVDKIAATFMATRPTAHNSNDQGASLLGGLVLPFALVSGVALNGAYATSSQDVAMCEAAPKSDADANSKEVRARVARLSHHQNRACVDS